MLRLSNLTALDITSTEFVEDLSIDKLYLYQENTTSDEKSMMFVKDDAYKSRQMTRNNAVASFFDNTLLGTSNFYPEQGLGLTHYHQDAELSKRIDFEDVPMMQYKRAFLYFAQGSLSSNQIVAHYLRIYVNNENGKTVDLVSMVEFMNDSNINAKTSKIFESQIFNEALEISFPDVEYIVNSTNPEIMQIREYLFGTYTPKTYFIEYSVLTQDMIDDFSEAGLQFTEINLSTVNYQNLKITEEIDELFGRLQLTDNNFSLTSSLGHTIYDIETFIKNHYQINDETFSVQHIFTVTEYNSENMQLGIHHTSINNPANLYAPVKFRPLLSSATDHALIECMIKIQNGATGLAISKTSTFLLNDDNVDKFKAEETYAIELDNIIVTNVIEKQINQIVQESKTPNILYMNKFIYVQVMGNKDLQLSNGDSFVRIKSEFENQISSEKLFIRIGDSTIESEPHDKFLFKINQSLYYTKANSYLLLDSDLKVIQQGSLIKL